MDKNLHTGLLGLPIIRLDKSLYSSSRPNHNSLWQIFSKENTAEYWPAIERRFDSNQRLTDLEGKTVAMGAGGAAFSRVQFYMWIIYRANRVGMEQALREADDFLLTEEVDIVFIQYLFGPKLSAEIKIDECTSFKMIEEIDEAPELDEYIEVAEFSVVKVVTPTAALELRGKAPKIYDAAFGQNSLRTQQKLRDLTLLINAMDGLFCFPGNDTSRPAPNVPPGIFSGRSGSYWSHDFLPVKACAIEAEAVGVQLASLYARYASGSQTFQDRIRIALQRLGAAKSKYNQEDQALDLGICLEVLLIRSNEKADQLRTTAGLRGAWLIGKNLSDRDRVYKKLREVYDARSSVAHTGRLRGKVSLNSEHQDLVSAVARAIIQRGDFPDNDGWTQMTLGGSEPT